MIWNPGWNDVFNAKEWGKYPPEELIRFMGRHYFSSKEGRTIKVLEVGCGTGANVIFLAQEGCDVTGIDGSRVGLNLANQRLIEKGLRARLDQGDAMDLPYSDASFDCVLDIECIYANSLNDSRRIVNEIHRVLKPNGLFFSKTFMTGTSGEATGRKDAKEPNTYLEITDGPFNQGYGLIRLTSENEIPSLYGVFPDIEVDYVFRTDRNRTKEVREWLITCRK